MTPGICQVFGSSDTVHNSSLSVFRLHFTSLKLNIAHVKRWLEVDFPFGMVVFESRTVKLWEGERLTTSGG